MRKTYKYTLLVISVLLVIFAFTDLQISNAIYNSNSSFGMIFEAIGEFPAAVIATFYTVSLMLTRNKEKSVKYNLRTGGYIILLLLFALMAAMLPVKYFNGPTVLIPIIATLYIVISYIIAKKYSSTNREELRNAAIVGILTFVFVVITFNLVKMGWGRERYRHMIATGSFEGFSLWFTPQKLTTDNEFMSFPSGHSANAAIMIWITLIPTFITSLREKKNWFIGFSLLWILVVPISRIMVGAHFASDVTMGVTITLIIFAILESRYIKKEDIKCEENIGRVNT
ncbi:phosphatase PAP2 family protein [Clostridium sp. NSJ-49]|uniref:phosphatase PAP2 family protein n=1 Tax=Clostridium TaxID=1485 RepID=UPI00164CA887|nr:phosphatase PAP2 family protein [Clostridium sp. NSJ-49]MBC5625787.1 phosphatase PAP2 family protein [Clostridium sp. NSJ-49]